MLEAPDAHALARFYSALPGWPMSSQGPDGAAIRVPGTSSLLSFDNSPDFTPPAWPSVPGRQQMMMLMARNAGAARLPRCRAVP